MLIDTHCHLDLNHFADDRHQVVERALESGVERIIVPIIDLNNGEQVLELADTYPQVFAAAGVHPNSTAGWDDSWLDTIRTWANHPKVVAIGEIGLDYYWDKSPPETQQHAFRAQLELAAELSLPVIVHNRDSSDDVVRLLRESPIRSLERPGVLHSFMYEWETAEAVLKMNFYLGFTGPLTYKSRQSLRDILEKVPLNRILLETDAPFLPPHPYRGKRNEPAYVTLVADEMARTLGMPRPMIDALTTENAVCLFGRAKLLGDS